MNITYEVLEKDIEVCKDLCNKLMAFQKEQATYQKENFDGMSFETRMVPSHQKAMRSFTAVAKDGDKTVGYVFATIDAVSEAARAGRPPWAQEGGIGFFPDDLPLPQNIGTFNNLFVEEEYRKYKVGKTLTDMAMDWLKSFDDTKTLFVYVSNGNEGVIPFYKRYGFVDSHEVFGGFIHALWQTI